MVSSVIRRRVRRHYGGVYKKVRSVRLSILTRPWRPGTARVNAVRRSEYERAERRAEKSSVLPPLRKHRRKRGLRVGRVRSRGGKPPLIHVIPAPPSNRVTDRVIKRSMEQFFFWQRKTKSVVKRFRNLKKESDWFASRFSNRGHVVYEPRPVFDLFRSRFRALLKGELKGHRVIRPVLTRSFVAFFESHVPVQIPGSLGTHKLRALAEIIEELRFAQDNLSESDREEFLSSYVRGPVQTSQRGKLRRKNRMREGNHPPPGAPRILPGPKGKGFGSSTYPPTASPCLGCGSVVRFRHERSCTKVGRR
jgi:hypothetical protein